MVKKLTKAKDLQRKNSRPNSNSETPKAKSTYDVLRSQRLIITLLATTYFGLGEYRRTIRYLESWEDFIVRLDRETEPANVKQWQLILHFMSLLGDCQLAEGHCEKSIEIYNQVTRNYNQASLLISQ